MKRPRTRSRHPGSVDPRTLPPGTPYACKDPYVGAPVAVGKVAGRIVGCATPPAGQRGRYFAVGEIAPGGAIGRAWKMGAARKAALAARYAGPDFDLRPARRTRPDKGAGAPTAHKGIAAPPPARLLGLPAPHEEPVFHGELVDLAPARRLPFEPPRAASTAMRRLTPARLTPARPTPARPTPARPTPARPTPARPTPARPTPAARPRARALAAPPPPEARPASVATTPSRAPGVLAPSYLGLGVNFPRITATLAPGLPVLSLDLGDGFSAEVRRNLATVVRASIEQSGFALARGIRVTSSAPIPSHANLALPVTLAVLEAVGEIPAGALDGVLACAGLSLTGKLQDDRGTFLAVHHANEAGLAAAIIAGDATRAPSTLGPAPLYAADTLREVVEAIQRGGVHALHEARDRARYTPSGSPDSAAIYLSASEVPEHLRLPVALAAAGDMNLLVVTERSASVGQIAARALLSVLPPPSAEEAVAITDMASLFGPVRMLAAERPLAAPHHTVPVAGLVGSRASTATGVIPGELARANLGVFMLDQVPEFSREAIETLREPLTEGTVTVLRDVGGKTRRVVFPARFRLVASMTPCPCGRLLSGGCTCDAARIARWWERVPPWLLERFDLVTDDDMSVFAGGGSSMPAWIATVARARDARAARGGDPNAGTSHASGPAMRAAREDATDRRALQRLRVARVLADMRGEDVISEEHVQRALAYTFDPVRRYASGASPATFARAPKASAAAPEGIAALLPSLDPEMRKALDKALDAHRREGLPRPSDKALRTATLAPPVRPVLAFFPEASSLDWRALWNGKKAPSGASRDRYFTRMEAALTDRRRGSRADLATSLRVMTAHLKGMLDEPGLGDLAHRLARAALARYLVELAATLDAQWSAEARSTPSP